jgi:hypothetical protein
MENALMDGNLPFLDEKDDDLSAAPETPEPVQAEPKGEPEAAPPAAVVDDPVKNIPISALLDERDKRQQAAREAEELRREVAELKAKLNPPEKPDFYTDPEAALQNVQKAAQAIAVNTKLETSKFLAERDHGAETVAAAFEFFNANPHLSGPLLASPSPFHEAVKVYQKHKAMEDIGDDPSAYRARIEQEIRERLLAEMQTAQTAPKAPPPSMAAIPASGGGKAPPVSGFDALFKSE